MGIRLEMYGYTFGHDNTLFRGPECLLQTLRVYAFPFGLCDVKKKRIEK